MSTGVVVSILISGLFTGALARLAVPGPDPMPLWLTLAIGLTGSIVGAVVANVLFDGNGYVVSFGSLGVAIGLVLAYRRFVQRRPLVGEGARAFPKRGLGIEGYRERLRAFGVDPDRSPAASPDRNADHARMLEELHRADLLDDAELAEKQETLERRRDDST